MSSTDGKKKRELSTSFVTGAIALAFLIIGYQTALFIHRAAALKLLADHSSPDTVYVTAGKDDKHGACTSSLSTATSCASSASSQGINRRNFSGSGAHYKTGAASRAIAGSDAGSASNAGMAADIKAAKTEIAEAFLPRKYESFRFDPNTASVQDLCRLGFSLKQAESIDNYRQKGGRFRRKSDFARSYVVQDSVFKRLEPYIDIPLLDINAADSAAFDSLPGIGGYFASKMAEHRKQLGGYSCKEQLMDIYRFDREKFDRIADLIEVRTPPTPFRLWSLPADSLRSHPYIRQWSIAKAIVLYRDNNPRNLWTIEGLRNAGIIDDDNAAKLSRCKISD